MRKAKQTKATAIPRTQRWFVCDIANSLSSLHTGAGSLTVAAAAVATAAVAEAAESCEAGGAESWSMIWRLLCLSASNVSQVTERVAETTDDNNGLDQILTLDSKALLHMGQSLYYVSTFLGFSRPTHSHLSYDK